MSGMAEGSAPGQGRGQDIGQDDGQDEDSIERRESLAAVLASIRDLVSAESRARQTPGEGGLATVLMLTPQMRVDASARSGEILSADIDARPARSQGAPIFDEEALRAVVNAIVREELQGELGERISRNLRKLIRRELAQMLELPREK